MATYCSCIIDIRIFVLTPTSDCFRLVLILTWALLSYNARIALVVLENRHVQNGSKQKQTGLLAAVCEAHVVDSTTVRLDLLDGTTIERAAVLATALHGKVNIQKEKVAKHFITKKEGHHIADGQHESTNGLLTGIYRS